MADQAFKVDLTKPLVFQVGHLGASYDEWVHKPIISKDTPRFFENNFMELMTRIVWWAIPLVWLPVAYLFVSSSVEAGITPCHVAAAVFSGVFMWTLLEYCLHRFLFHMKTTSYWGNTLHYLLHGCHHKHPMDGLRLVFPPAAAAIIAVVLWALFKLLTPARYCPALFGGLLLGYVMYDCTHYYLHHGKPFQGITHELKTCSTLIEFSIVTNCREITWTITLRFNTRDLESLPLCGTRCSEHLLREPPRKSVDQHMDFVVRFTTLEFFSLSKVSNDFLVVVAWYLFKFMSFYLLPKFWTCPFVVRMRGFGTPFFKNFICIHYS